MEQKNYIEFPCFGSFAKSTYVCTKVCQRKYACMIRTIAQHSKYAIEVRSVDDLPIFLADSDPNIRYIAMELYKVFIEKE